MGTAIGELIESEREEIGLAFLSGRKVGIDSYNILYQFLSSIRGQDGTPLMDGEGRVTSHLTGLLYRTVNLLEKGIKPVFVFDGKPSELKMKTIQERVKIRTEAEKKHKDALEKGDMEGAKKYGSRALKLTGEMVDEAKKLVELLGLPLVQAPSEGEAQIAHMVSKGELYGCVTQDYDALLFGAPILLRNIASTGRRKVPGKNLYIDISPEKIELERVLKSLNITRRKLIWLGILIGTDFNEKFPRIGPKTALELVRKHDSFGSIIAETKHGPAFDYKDIEELFLKPKTTADYTIKFSAPHKEGVIELLCEEHDFSEERVRSALSKLESKASEKGEQSRLGQWV